MAERQQYRRKPRVVEAMQVLDDIRVHHAIQAWAESVTPAGVVIPVVISAFGAHMIVHTAKGTQRADLGDWIVRDESGAFEKVSPEAFAEAYERVEEAA